MTRRDEDTTASIVHHESAMPSHENPLVARESVAGDLEDVAALRDEAEDLRSQALSALSAAEAARVAREDLLVQMREANEQLVIATLRSDELMERAVAAHALAAESATVELARREHAESLTAQLQASEDALRTSERDAHAHNRAKDEFLAMLGHELRAPLSPIMLALDLIAMDGTDPRRREHMIIERQVHLLVRLVDDLLDLARIRSGKVELRSAPIQLSEVVAHAVETAGPALAAKGHALTIEVPTGLAIQGDLLRLTQSVANLLTNAAKYTPAGGAVHVSGERRGPNVRVRVADNGIGISAKMLPLVFDRFAQETQSQDNPPGGLGLGLSIVRSLVAMHGGTVTAHSAGVGRGSEFVIELPASTGVVSAAVPTVLALVPVASVAEQRVLVIDDNSLVADLVALALGRLGHEVRIALDPAAAISIARDFLPNIVLVDVGLPGLAGYEVAPLVRAAISPHDVHFIALSGRGGATERQRSVDAGFDDHLVKPVDVAMLERSIEQSLRR